MIMRKGFFAAALLTASASQSLASEVGPAERYFAAKEGITLEQASERLELRMETGFVVNRLIKEFGSRYAGFDFSESPMTVKFKLTGEQPENSRYEVTRAGIVKVVFQAGAPHSIRELDAALLSGDLNQAFPNAKGIGIDQRSGEIVVTLPAGPERGRSSRRDLLPIPPSLGLPVRIEVTRVPSRLLAGQPVRAGGRAVNNGDWCTFGFRAYTEDGTPGYITAAHCPDLLRYESAIGSSDNVVANLPVDSNRSRWDASHDVQWHPVASPLDATWTIFSQYGASAASMPEPFPELVQGWENLLILCHRGTRTNWSCGVLSRERYQPSSNVCNGQTCSSDWLQVAPSGAIEDLLCDGGDSGGPVVANGNIPIGIATAAESEGPLPGQCTHLVVMSLSRVKSGIGVDVR